MGYWIGDSVRMRRRSAIDERLGEAAALIGTVGDVCTDDLGDRVSVVFEPATACPPPISCRTWVWRTRFFEPWTGQGGCRTTRWWS